MKNLKMKYHGFSPSEYTTHYLQEKLSIIQEESPEGSNIQASFSRENKLFKGVVSILTPAGHFFAKAQGAKLKEVTQKINYQLQKQISKWRDQTHKKKSLKNFNETFLEVS